MTGSEWIILVVAAFCIGGIGGWFFGQKDGYAQGRIDERKLTNIRDENLITREEQEVINQFSEECG